MTGGLWSGVTGDSGLAPEVEHRARIEGDGRGHRDVFLANQIVVDVELTVSTGASDVHDFDVAGRLELEPEPVLTG